MKQPEGFRGDVQGLRGVAVLLVVVFHAWPAALPGGYIGVDVFFVISGYLITGQLLREVEVSGRIDFPAFYARRIRRLLPAAALVIAACVAVAYAAYPPLEAAAVASAAIAAALYASNLWFAALSIDYLQEDLHRNLLQHTWSLGVEEQFYLVWPALVAASALAWRRISSRRGVAWMVGSICLLSFLAGLWLTSVVQSWAFYSLPTRAWELGLGAAAALLEGRARALGGAARRTMVIAGLAGIVAAALLFSAATRFPGYAALLPVLGAVLVISGGASGDGSRGRSVLGFEPLQRLGDLSYSWYLWHWPALILVADLWPTVDRNLVAAAGVAVSLGLARLSFVFVEDPVRRHAGLRARPAHTFALALTLMIGTVGLALAAQLAGSGEPLADSRQRMEQASRDRPRLYEDRCFASALDVEPPACSYGAAGARRTVALVGDSHAAQWFPALERLALANGWRLEVFVKAACPLAAVETFDPKLNRPYVECTQWREKVMERLSELRPTLVVASNSSFYDPFVRRDSVAIAGWQRGLDESLERLAEVVDHVVLIRDTPLPGFHVPRCLARAATQGAGAGGECTYSLRESVLVEAHVLERAAAARRPGVSVIDLSESICASATCPTARNGVVLFHDSQHLSATFASSLAEPLWLKLPAVVRAALAG